MQMIQRQREFQQRCGYNFPMMTTQQRIAYVKDMVLAATAELHEALDETSWKPWTHGDTSIDDTKFCAELVDVTCFLLNLWLVGNPDLSVEQLSYVINHTHANKMLINHQRQSEGYDGQAKCPQCRRALDDPGVECEVRTDGYHCAKTGTTYLNDARS